MQQTENDANLSVLFVVDLPLRVTYEAREFGVSEIHHFNLSWSLQFIKTFQSFASFPKSYTKSDLAGRLGPSVDKWAASVKQDSGLYIYYATCGVVEDPAGCKLISDLSLPNVVQIPNVRNKTDNFKNVKLDHEFSFVLNAIIHERS